MSPLPSNGYGAGRDFDTQVMFFCSKRTARNAVHAMMDGVWEYESIFNEEESPGVLIESFLSKGNTYPGTDTWDHDDDGNDRGGNGKDNWGGLSLPQRVENDAKEYGVPQLEHLHERAYAEAGATIIDGSGGTLKPEQARSQWRPLAKHTMIMFGSWVVHYHVSDPLL